MKDNVILEVKNVEKFFYGNKKLFQKDRPVVKAVNNVSFTINEGETFGIVGESGCGKSTLGRTVIRLLNPTNGQVIYKGTDLATLSGEEMRKLRQEIQIIFQDPYASLNPRMTVRELIQAPLDVYSHESETTSLWHRSKGRNGSLNGVKPVNILIFPRDRCQKSLCIRMLRILEYLSCRCILNDHTCIHDHDLICHLCYNTHIVSD